MRFSHHCDIREIKENEAHFDPSYDINVRENSDLSTLICHVRGEIPRDSLLSTLRHLVRVKGRELHLDQR